MEETIQCSRRREIESAALICAGGPFVLAGHAEAKLSLALVCAPPICAERAHRTSAHGYGASDLSIALPLVPLPHVLALRNDVACACPEPWL